MGKPRGLGSLHQSMYTQGGSSVDGLSLGEGYIKVGK